jgi:deferrochelatase/peroxidase EfeB
MTDEELQPESNPVAGPPAPEAETSPAPARKMSRRGLFAGAAGTLAFGALAGIGGTFATQAALNAADENEPSTQYPFYGGVHQAGIRTEPQRYTMFMTFDLASPLVSDLQVLLAQWSAAIAQLMQGKTIGDATPTRQSAIPTDTGEALDLGPNGLTVTVGLGPAVFDDRFGLKARRPALLKTLPRLPSDQLDPSLTGGDLSLQASADDPQVAYHAIRDLARLARGTATTRWTVNGFGRASAGPDQQTPRNLMGFKDGTRNISTDADYSKFVWLDGVDQKWMAGGTYQVARKIQMNIEIWDADYIGDQQAVFGRKKGTGAPLTGRNEHDTPDFHARSADGTQIISPVSHVALAAHENNDGIKILRRSYNYTDGINQFGQLDAGLIFIAYMNDPGNFITLQTKLGSVDKLNAYISHVGSALFAVPPAPRVGSYIGEALFS